jgi:hypothetical protein
MLASSVMEQIKILSSMQYNENKTLLPWYSAKNPYLESYQKKKTDKPD